MEPLSFTSLASLRVVVDAGRRVRRKSESASQTASAGFLIDPPQKRPTVNPAFPGDSAQSARSNHQGVDFSALVARDQAHARPASIRSDVLVLLRREWIGSESAGHLCSPRDAPLTTDCLPGPAAASTNFRVARPGGSGRHGPRPGRRERRAMSRRNGNPWAET
jgi:hypothetical protein